MAYYESSRISNIVYKGRFSQEDIEALIEKETRNYFRIEGKADVLVRIEVSPSGLVNGQVNITLKLEDE